MSLIEFPIAIKYNDISIIFPSSLHYEQAFKVYNEKDNLEGKLENLIKIGELYYVQKDMWKSLKKLEEAYQIILKNGLENTKTGLQIKNEIELIKKEIVNG